MKAGFDLQCKLIAFILLDPVLYRIIFDDLLAGTLQVIIAIALRHPAKVKDDARICWNELVRVNPTPDQC